MHFLEGFILGLYMNHCFRLQFPVVEIKYHGSNSFIKTVLSNLYKNTLDDSAAIAKGRGLTPEKAFKTINACIMYVCNNYNLGQYTALINIAEGDYSDPDGEAVHLRFYNANGGSMVLVGAGQDKTILPGINVSNSGSVTWWIRKLTVNGNMRQSTYGRWLVFGGGIIVYLQAVTLDLTKRRGIENHDDIPFEVADGARVYVQAHSSEILGSGIIFNVKNSTAEISSFITVRVGGTFKYSADINIDIGGSSTKVVNAFIYSQRLAIVERLRSIYEYPGRSPEIICNGTIVGKKYLSTLNAIINTGGTCNNWPGTLPGQTDSGGQAL